MLNKIVLKSLLKTKKLILAIFLLFIVTQMLIVAVKTTYPSLEKSVNSFYETANVEDFRIYAIPKIRNIYDEEWQSSIQDKYDVSLEPKEYYSTQQEDTTYGILKYNKNDEINKPKVEEGALPENKDEIFLAYDYAKANEIQVGDTYQIRDDSYTVSGIGYIPDFTFPIDITSGEMSLGTDSFITLYMNSQNYKEIAGSKSILYFSSKFNSEVADKSEVYKSISNDYTYNIPILDENGNPQLDENRAIITESIKLVPFIFDVDTNPGFHAIKKEISGEETMLSVLSIVILIIALAVIVMLFNNIFNNQKKEIGILKAEGITQNELTTRYVAFLGLILFIASLIGIELGFMIRSALVSIIQTYFSFPILVTPTNLLFTSFISIISIIVVVLIVVYFVSIRKKLSQKPILLLKNIETEKPPRLKFEFLTKNLNFVNKYKVNILLRNLGISLLLIFGVFVSSFLLLMGGTLKTSFDNALNATNNKDLYSYDYMATFSSGMQDPDYDQNSLIVEYTDIQDVTSNSIISQYNSSIRIFAYDYDQNDYINLQQEDGEQGSGELDESDIYITNLTQKIYGLEQGDYIQIQNPYDVRKTINLRVGGIIDGSTTNQIYIDIDLLHKLFDLKDDYANAEVGVGDPKEEIYAYDSDATYKYLDDSTEDTETVAKSMNISIGIITGVAIFISVITLSIITSIIISKNKKTISIMKVLGYTNKEINSMIISPYKWILIIVYFASIPLFGYIIQQIVNTAVKDMEIAITIRIPFQSTIIGFIAIFVIYLISLFISKRSIKKITLAESLKIEE